MLKRLNHTFINLIPMGDKAATVNQFRSISLCNVVYNTISKSLANHLKPLLPKLISPWQAAFFPGRKIQDNNIIVQEILHAIDQKKGKCGWVGLKMDMKKAYDRMEWSFIIQDLRCFGFPNVWIQWVEQCIFTSSFFVLINGGPYGFVKPHRGLRQGDPLSPFLFIIASEVLLRLLCKTELNGELNGIKVSRTSPSISHLQFADNLFIFVMAKEENLVTVKECLDKYMEWSGQAVNNAKSNMFFSKNVTTQDSINLSFIMGLKQAAPKGKYLGLPLKIGAKKKKKKKKPL
jgi:hypothetical protein